LQLNKKIASLLEKFEQTDYIEQKTKTAHPPYFKENITIYTEKASKIFGSEISTIVE